MGILSPAHMLIFGVIAILLFGNRLPTVARSLGRSLSEFKKGMSDLEQDFKSSIYSEPKQRVTYSNSNPNEQTEQPAGPRFEPPKV
jgi:sec-independent protein translocase protein TatA